MLIAVLGDGQAAIRTMYQLRSESNRIAVAEAIITPWFERAVAAAPDLVEARLNLGIALQQNGQTARAADEYKRVLAAPGRHDREKQAATKLLATIGNAR